MVFIYRSNYNKKLQNLLNKTAIVFSVLPYVILRRLY